MGDTVVHHLEIRLVSLTILVKYMPEYDIKFEDDFFNTAIASRYKAYGKKS